MLLDCDIDLIDLCESDFCEWAELDLLLDRDLWTLLDLERDFPDPDLRERETDLMERDLDFLESEWWLFREFRRDPKEAWLADFTEPTLELWEPDLDLTEFLEPDLDFLELDFDPVDAGVPERERLAVLQIINCSQLNG